MIFRVQLSSEHNRKFTPVTSRVVALYTTSHFDTQNGPRVLGGQQTELETHLLKLLL